jgi:hypothetical protein
MNPGRRKLYTRGRRRVLEYSTTKVLLIQVFWEDRHASIKHSKINNKDKNTVLKKEV